MPVNAQILTVQVQNGQPCLWARVNSGDALETRHVEIFGTGHPMPTGVVHNYIGTFQMNGGALVFHVFERRSDKV